MRALSRPLRARGAVAARREPWLERTRRTLRVRSGGRCEGCGARDIALDPAHLFGRGNKGIGEPWASCPEFMAALCRDDHNAVDRNLAPALRERLQWLAVWRLCELLHVTLDYAGDVPLEAARELVRRCEAEHIEYPGYAT